MRVQTCQLLLVLLGTCIWTSLTRSVLEKKQSAREDSRLSGPREDYNGHLNLVTRNISQLAARTGDVLMPDDSPPGIGCRTLCSAKIKSIKRDSTDLEYPRDLAKRAFDPWPPEENGKNGKSGKTDRDDWMIKACDGLTEEEEVVPAWASDSPGYASVKTAVFGDTPFRYGMQGICGCTLLFVASRNRVYIGHYWEDECFGKMPGDTSPLHFAEQVTGFLMNGFEAPKSGSKLLMEFRFCSVANMFSKFEGQDSLSMHAADFKDDEADSQNVQKQKLVAYIYSPEAEADEPNAGSFLYKDKVQEMAATVAGILDIDVTRVVQRMYKAIDAGKDHEQQVLENSAAGKLIFDYDPNGGDEQEPIAWRLIWQNQIIDARQWAAQSSVSAPRGH